ncbi:hypothetical protein Droror1_Dr00027914 [Drosera rotundifolia]
MDDAHKSTRVERDGLGTGESYYFGEVELDGVDGDELDGVDGVELDGVDADELDGVDADELDGVDGDELDGVDDERNASDVVEGDVVQGDSESLSTMVILWVNVFLSMMMLMNSITYMHF